MKPLACVLFGACAAVLLRAGEPPSRASSVAELGWLSGTWRCERGGRVTTEVWSGPAGGMMLGVSHTVAGERTIEYEFLVLRAEAGGLVYVAMPSGQRETSFRLVRAGAREVVFENPAHEFPQRISYALREDGTLLASIEGTKDGRTRRVEFPFRRVP